MIRVTSNSKNHSKEIDLPNVQFGDTVKSVRVHLHSDYCRTIKNGGVQGYLLTWARVYDRSLSRKAGHRWCAQGGHVLVEGKSTCA